MTSTTTCRAELERGIALPFAIVLAVVFAMIVGGVMVTGMLTSDRAASARDEANGRAAAEIGISYVQRALNARLLGEHDEWSLTAAELASLVRPTDLVGADPEVAIVPNASLPSSLDRFRLVDETAPFAVPVGSRVTMRVRSDASTWQWWQVIASGRPDWRDPTTTTGATGSRYVVYIRGWTTSTTTDPIARDAVVLRAGIRAGRFSDYQLITDGPIRLKGVGGAPVNVDGPVHSNGFPDMLFSNAGGHTVGATTYQAVIEDANCSARARVSTARGGIYLTGAGCGSTPQDPDNGRTLSLRLLDDSVRFIRSGLCGTSLPTVRVQCASGGGTINLGSFAPGMTHVLVNDGEVNVSGTVPANTRVSIFVQTNDAASTQQRANIVVRGAVSYGSNGSLGLFAGGDVVMSMPPDGPCVTRLQAGVIASSGAVTLSEQYRTPFENPGPTCPNTVLEGSYSTHYSPFLAKRDPSTNSVYLGYVNRTYSYDTNLYHAPPPLVPLTGAWQRDQFSEVNASCFNETPASINLTTAACT